MKALRLANENPDGVEPINEAIKDVKVKNDDKKKDLTFKNVFSLENLKSSFTVAFKKREDGSRHFIVMLILLFGMYSFANIGVSIINVPYIKKQFIWDNPEDFNEFWSTYNSLQTGLNVVSIGLVLPLFTKVMKLNDLTIVFISLSSLFGAIAIILVAEDYRWIYLSCVLKMFSDITTISVRACLTKVVDKDDIGKVFACVGAVQAMVGFLNPLYNLIYQETYDWHPGFCYCLSLTVLCFMISMTAYGSWFYRKVLKRIKLEKMPKSPRFQDLHNQTETDNI